MGDRIINTLEASALTSVPASTLRYWRYAGKGPRSFRLGGRKVAYRESDVLEWLEGQYNAEVARKP